MKRSFYKRILLFLISILLLTGCSNEKYLNKNKSNYATYEFLSSVKFNGNKINDEIEKIREEKEKNEEQKKLERLCLVSKREDYIVKSYDDLYGYVREYSEVKEEYKEDSKTIASIDEFEKVQILKKYTNNYYYIKFNSGEEILEGYISTSKLEELPSKYVEVDISDQKLKLYIENNISLETNVVTGLDSDVSRQTPYGYYEIYVKQRYVTLKGDDYESDVAVWMPFYLGYGIHDASWRSSFGGEIYKTNGSHGCVNMPPEKARILFNEVDLGTKVLVHK